MHTDAVEIAAVIHNPAYTPAQKKRAVKRFVQNKSHPLTQRADVLELLEVHLSMGRSTRRCEYNKPIIQKHLDEEYIKAFLALEK